MSVTLNTTNKNNYGRFDITSQIQYTVVCSNARYGKRT